MRGEEKTAQFGGQELFALRGHAAREEQFVHLFLTFARFGGAINFELAVADALEDFALAPRVFENPALRPMLFHQVGHLFLQKDAELPVAVGAKGRELQLRRGHPFRKKSRHASPIFFRGPFHPFDFTAKPPDLRGERLEAEPLESFATLPQSQHGF